MTRRTASPLSLVLLGLGVFLLVLAPMLAWYVEPRAKRTPIDVDQITVFEGKGSYFDTKKIKTVEDQNLTITPSAMPPKAHVLFRVDGIGQLSGIWLLTAQEAAKYKKPTTSWTPSTPASPKPGTGPPKDDRGATKDDTPVNPSPTGR